MKMVFSVFLLIIAMSLVGCAYVRDDGLAVQAQQQNNLQSAMARLEDYRVAMKAKDNQIEAQKNELIKLRAENAAIKVLLDKDGIKVDIRSIPQIPVDLSIEFPDDAEKQESSKTQEIKKEKMEKFYLIIPQ
jgi:ParB-like chromosome segregation protein Spo0J